MKSGLEFGAASYKKTDCCNKLDGEAFTFPDISKTTLFIFRYDVTRPGIWTRERELWEEVTRVWIQSSDSPSSCCGNSQINFTKQCRSVQCCYFKLVCLNPAVSVLSSFHIPVLSCPSHVHEFDICLYFFFFWALLGFLTKITGLAQYICIWTCAPPLIHTHYIQTS